MRRLLGLFVVAAGVLAGAIAFRRRFGGRTERVDLYYEDGSIVSLPRGSPEGDQLLPLARDVLRVGRG